MERYRPLIVVKADMEDNKAMENQKVRKHKKPRINRSTYWKYNCCTSDAAKPRLHAGHFRCRVEMRVSTHCLQKATQWGVVDSERGACKYGGTHSACIW